MSVREYATAKHEASHAIVGIALGLPVLWVSVVPGFDEEEQMAYPAACKIRDEAQQDPRLVLCAMAAPAYAPTGDEDVDMYAAMEADMAYEKADALGLDADAIMLDAERHARKGLAEIEALAERLTDEGRVEFVPVTT